MTTASATVLIVEDDPGVCELVVKLLSGLGLDTLEAENAAAALVLIDRYPNIGILFTDVVLPGGTGGADLAAIALQKLPDLKIIYTSGYPDGELPDLSFGNGAVKFLRKPYRKAQLAKIFQDLFQ